MSGKYSEYVEYLRKRKKVLKKLVENYDCVENEITCTKQELKEKLDKVTRVLGRWE